jgi:hypothetical protein
MDMAIDYEVLLKRLHKALNVAKKLGLEIIPGGGYATDYSIHKLPKYRVGLFGALSIVDGQGARSKLGLTYLQTSAIEAGFNSVPHYDAPVVVSSPRKIKKDEVYLKLEAIGKELAKKVITPYTPIKKRAFKKSPPRNTSAWREASSPTYYEPSITPPSNMPRIELAPEAIGVRQAWYGSGGSIALPALTYDGASLSSDLQFAEVTVSTPPAQNQSVRGVGSFDFSLNTEGDWTDDVMNDE